MSQEKCRPRFQNQHPWKPSQPLSAAAAAPLWKTGPQANTDWSELNQRMSSQMTILAAQIQALTTAVAALTQAVQENTQAMTAPEEDEEVAQTGGLLGTATDDEPESPHL